MGSESKRRLSAIPQIFSRVGRRAASRAWLNAMLALVSLYFFLAAINVMSHGLKVLANEPETKDRIHQFLAWASNPVAALLAAVFITAVVQSSSFTTSLIVVLAADDVIDLQTAVYAVMGANIGTSVTNIIVALGSARIRRQFRKAFTAALVHDVFNWLTVAVLFPIEWITSAMSRDGLGILARSATWMAEAIGLQTIDKATNPIKVITGPVIDRVDAVSAAIFGTTTGVGTSCAIIGLVMLLLALVFLVRNLKGAMLRHIENWFRRIFFRNDAAAYTVGALTTVLVQSSSVTTSLIVPLAGAGAVKIRRVFPYTLGANLGTTITGLIAATAKIGTDAGVVAMAVAFSHITFNLIGSAIWYPLRRVPIGIARWYGRLAARSRRYAILFLLMVFIVIPIIGLTVTEIWLRVFGGS